MLIHENFVWVTLTSANGSDHEAQVFVGEEFSRNQVLAKAIVLFSNLPVLVGDYLSHMEVTRMIEDADSNINEVFVIEDGKCVREFSFHLGWDIWSVKVMEFLSPILIYTEQ